MFSFAGVIVSVAIIGVLWMFYEAKVTQRTRTFSENKAHTLNILSHLVDTGARPERMLPEIGRAHV